MGQESAALAARAIRVYAANVARLLSNAGFTVPQRLAFVGALMDAVISKGADERPTGAILSIPPSEMLTTLQLQDHVARALSPPGIVVRFLLVCRSADLTARMEAVIAEQIRSSDLFGQVSANSYILSVIVKNQNEIAEVEQRVGRALQGGYRLDVAFERVAEIAVIERLLAENHDYRPSRGLPRRDKLNLALTGGAARAVAHAGVLDVLRSDGIEVTGVAGTSAGALVGAMFAMGESPDQIGERFAEFSRSTLFRELKHSFIRYRRRSQLNRSVTSALSRTSLVFISDQDLHAVSEQLYHDFIAYFIGADRTIESLSLPMAICATNLSTGSVWIGTEGSLHHALRCACALPGLFPPQPHSGALLVDGSPICETPIAGLPFLPPTSDSLLVYLDRPERRAKAPNTSLELAMQINSVTHTHLIREQLLKASHTMSIDVGAFGWLEFRKSAELVQIGRDAALKALGR